jgi:hypothetical protein
MEAVVTGSEDGAVKVHPVTDTAGGWQTSVSGAISCLAVSPTSTDRIDEVAVGYSPGVFSIVRRVWPFCAVLCLDTTAVLLIEFSGLSS